MDALCERADLVVLFESSVLANRKKMIAQAADGLASNALFKSAVKSANIRANSVRFILYHEAVDASSESR